jgi:hypothetical protein
MDLHGSLSDNLQAALKSATRHRNVAVYSDTRDYWDRLLLYAQSLSGGEGATYEIAELARKLAFELVERDRRAASGPL